MESLKRKTETPLPTTNTTKSKTDAPTQTNSETLTRKELGKLFNVSHEAIRLWEQNGKLVELGWERIQHLKSPAKYSHTNPPNDPASAQDYSDSQLDGT